ncbi:MAG TPA: YfiR family protein [Thermoanaerobaculia bacterium]|nr:YfiR family protein [Thermoanaerobaculia bacterium]
MASPETTAARRRSRGFAHVALAFVIGFSLSARLSPPAAGQVMAGAEEVKAAFLVKLLGYTEWPPSSFEHAESPLRVLVVGNEEVAQALEEVARRTSGINGHPIEVVFERLPGRELRASDDVLEEARRSHAVYLEEDDRGRAIRFLEMLDKSDVLTVGGLPGFAASGGMIGLREEGRRIVFDANPQAIRSSSLQVSARVLQLARVVHPGSS